MLERGDRRRRRDTAAFKLRFHAVASDLVQFVDGDKRFRVQRRGDAGSVQKAGQ